MAQELKKLRRTNTSAEPEEETTFIPDTFEPDEEETTFIPDSFEPEEPTKFTGATAPLSQVEEQGTIGRWWHAFADPLSDAPSRFANKVADYIDDPMTRGSDTRPIRSFVAGGVQGLGNIGDQLTSPIGMATALLGGAEFGAAKASMPGLASLAGIGTRAAAIPQAAHGAINLLHPESTTEERLWGALEATGGVAGAFHKTPSVAPKPKVTPPRPQLLLEAGDVMDPTIPKYSLNDPYIGGEGGLQRQSLITPQEDARLSGYDFEIDANGDIVPAGQPGVADTGTTLDIDAVRERNRIANLGYTEHELLGGTRLEVPDDAFGLPPESGDTSFGFRPESLAGTPTEKLRALRGNSLKTKLERSRRHPEGVESLPYPYNVVPNSLRPRTNQTVQMATAGDRFAQSVEQATQPVTFANENAPTQMPGTEAIDLRGGTSAITPDEDILPSASRTPPHAAEQVRETGVPFDDRLANHTARNIDPIVPGASAEIAPVLEQNASLPRRLADWLMVSGERQFEKMGPVGQEIRRVLSAVEYKKRELFNKWADPFMKATKGLSPEETANFVDVMEGKAQPLTPNVAAAFRATSAITEEMTNLAETAGVRVIDEKGVQKPFTGKPVYWPKRPTNPVTKNQFVENVIQNNPWLSPEQAKALATKMQASTEYTNSPRQMNSVPNFEYRKDLNAMIDHMADMSDIISRADELGAGDVTSSGSLIDRLIKQTDDPVKTRELVRTHLRGGMDKDSPAWRAVKAVNRFATKTQVFSKLGLFTISNINNQLPTLLHADLAPFFSGAAKAIGMSPTLKAVAREYGTASVGDLAVGILSEAGKKQVPVVGKVVQQAENFARTVATGAGMGTAKSLFKGAKAGDKMSIRRLQNLLLDNDLTEILKQPELTPEQLKYATQRFVELAQQLDSGMKLPPAWVNEPLLHIPLIFKKFAFQGTKSVKDAIMMNPARNIPLFLVAAPIFGELTGGAKSIVYGLIRGTVNPDENVIDSIAYELGHRGDFAGKITGLDSENSSLEFVANRIAADYLQSWGLGLFADMLQGVLGGKASGYTALAGPFADQAITLITAAPGAVGELINPAEDETYTNIKTIGREAIRSTPALGPGLQRGLLPYESQKIE